jgi:5-methylcytosine-specific restriction protein B
MDSDGKRLLQLSTFGSDDRRSESKVSQTIQIDEAMAKELSKVLAEVFASEPLR